MRVLFKLSGESLQSDVSAVIDLPALNRIAEQIAQVSQQGHQVAIVVGAGNILRGAHLSKDKGFDDRVADQMGMVATHINALALAQALKSLSVMAAARSVLSVHSIIPEYHIESALDLLEAGNVVIVSGGTGHAYCTTDSAAALRASELSVDMLLKATTVNGIYDKDPNAHDNAQRYRLLPYQTVIDKDLQVMDALAFTLCRDRGIPIRVFSLYETDALAKALNSEDFGTLVTHNNEVVFYD